MFLLNYVDTQEKTAKFGQLTDNFNYDSMLVRKPCPTLGHLPVKLMS